MQIGVEAARATETRRVFVIDNEDITRIAIQFMLQDEIETHEFMSIANAQRRGAELRPSVVIVGVDTLVSPESTSSIDQFKSWNDNVKIVVSGDNDKLEQYKTNNSGNADAFLPKPFTVEKTRKVVDRLLGRKSNTVITLHAL